MSGINPDFWEKKNPVAMAAAMVGRCVVVGDVEASVLVSEGYSRAGNDKGTYKPLLQTHPGHIYCATVMGHPLLLIACRSGNELGGCVRIKTIEVNGEKFTGPKAVAAKLGLVSKMTGSGKWVDEFTYVIHPDGLPEPAFVAGTSACATVGNEKIGAKFIEQYLTMIVAKYLRECKTRHIGLHAFINELITQSPTKAAFKRLIGAA